MRILYFSFVELDIPNACQTHTLGVLRGLSNNGCLIDALVPRPLKMRPKIPSVQFYYLWPWQFSKAGEIWIKLLSAFLMIFLCLRNRYDAIYVREKEINPGPRLTSKIFKIPFYIEINDLIVPTLSESGLSSSLLKMIKKQQELDFRQSAGLVVPSVQRRNWIINQYNLPQDQVHLVMNGADVNKENIIDRVHVKKRLGLFPNSFCLGFLGTIYERYDFNLILEAIYECQNLIAEIALIIVGDGPLKSEIKRKVNELHLEKRIIFTGYIEQEKLGNFIAAFDIGLMILDKKNAESAGPVHTKLSTYAMYGVPVLTAGSSLKGYPKELTQGLYIVPPENRNAMIDQIFKIYNNPKERNEKAKILHDYAIKNLTWNAVTKKILDIIKSDINLSQNEIYGT